jgi:hypothetical protein
MNSNSLERGNTLLRKSQYKMKRATAGHEPLFGSEHPLFQIAPDTQM